jgi:hypothetical protein
MLCFQDLHYRPFQPAIAASNKGEEDEQVATYPYPSIERLIKRIELTPHHKRLEAFDLESVSAASIYIASYYKDMNDGWLQPQ